MKSKVEIANPASCQLFGQHLDRLRNHTAAQLINGFNFLRWLEGNPQTSHNEHVVINGQNFLMEITPVYLQDENDQHVLTGAVVMLRSTIRMGRQLQNITSQDVSAFSQIVAVSPKMKHVVEQARKLAMLSAPLLITGDTGTGKDLFAHACHQASPRAGKPYLALNCASIPEDAVESELFGHAPEGKKASSSRRMVALFCWMKLARCHHVCRPNYCVFLTTVLSAVLVRTTKFMWMYG